jgi:hypothetical protein
VAPKWLAIVSGVEIENPARTPSGCGQSARPYREDGQRQSPVAHGATLWRATEARPHRERPIDLQLPPATDVSSAEPGLAHLPRNELAGIWAAGLLVVQTLTFKTLYVLFFRHERRQLVHVNATAHPTVAWVWQQLLNATPDGRQPRHLIHDRDGVYGVEFDARLEDWASTESARPCWPQGRMLSQRGWCARFAGSASTT